MFAPCRPTFSTDQVELRLLDTLTRLPVSSSLDESSPPPRRPYVEVDRLMLLSVRVCQPAPPPPPPARPLPYGGESRPERTEPSRLLLGPLKKREMEAKKPRFFFCPWTLDVSEDPRRTLGRV
jgi:hypothetical protein